MNRIDEIRAWQTGPVAARLVSLRLEKDIDDIEYLLACIARLEAEKAQVRQKLRDLSLATVSTVASMAYTEALTLIERSGS